MKNFVNNSFKTLSNSSQGQYSERTDDIKKLRIEMLDGNFGSFHTDRQRLIEDRQAVSRDVGRAFSRIPNKVLE